MSFFSCTMEITNSSSSVLSDPGKFLLGGQCSVPLSPLLMPGSSGSASFISTAGSDLMAVIVYNLTDQRMLVVFFNVASDRSNEWCNDFAVGIIDPIECDHNLLKLMSKGSEKGPLKASKAVAWWNSLVVRATMSDTPNAVLKVDVSNVPLSNKEGKACSK